MRAKEEQNHYNWLFARLTEACSIKVGMTREDLIKVFEPNGGLSLLPRRYVLRSCIMIKVEVEVEFELPKGISEKEFPSKDCIDLEMGKPLPIDSQIKITSISKPEFELMGMY